MTGNNKLLHEHGFTLVEIMAVIFIVGVMISLAALSVGGQADRALETEAQRLFQKIRTAADEAEVTRNELGMSLVDKNIYVFYRFDEQHMQWERIDGDSYKSVEVPSEYVLTLESKKNKNDLKVMYMTETNQKAVDYGEKAHDEPDIVFFSDGIITPFSLRINQKNSDKKGFLIVVDEKNLLNIIKIE